MRGIMYWMMMRMLLALYDLAASMYGASLTCRNMARYDLMLALNMQGHPDGRQQQQIAIK